MFQQKSPLVPLLVALKVILGIPSIYLIWLSERKLYFPVPVNLKNSLRGMKNYLEQTQVRCILMASTNK